MQTIKRYVAQLPRFATLALILLPLSFAGVYLCIREFNQQTRIALDRRGVIAELGASFIQGKFDTIVAAGISVASLQSVYGSIEKGDWGGSVKNLDSVRQMFPYIEAISILDKNGVLRAVTPPIPGIIGVDYSYRDYYKGVSKSWEPYISPAFNRSVDPKDALVAVAIPVRASGNEITGVVVLTVKLDAIVGWIRGIKVGPSGFAYVVDNKGQLVAHPQLDPAEKIIDYSSVHTTQKLLRGERGVEVIFNPIDKEERLTAYAPVEKYGYGVAITEPTNIAFADRKEKVTELALIWMFIIVIAGLSVRAILKDRDKIWVQLEQEKLLLGSVGDGVVAIDRDWKIFMWGKAAGELTGWRREEVIGKPLREILKFINEQSRKENYSFIDEAFTAGKTAYLSVGTLLVRKDGSEFPVGDSAAPIINVKGEVVGVIIVFRDATKEQEVMHLRSGFTYASHQLRTPITEALWNLSLVQKEEDPKKRTESVEVVQKSLMSVQRLSEHLVAVSEVDQGNIEVKESLVKIYDIFEGVQPQLKKLVERLGSTLSFGPVSVSSAINTDPSLIIKILKEIIENSLLYGATGSEVKVNTTISDGEVIFEVMNNGIGIPEEEQAIIFTKFFRASNHPSDVAGSGLGLYLAREYIRKLGGKIWFSSAEKGQTTFFISLPLGQQ